MLNWDQGHRREVENQGAGGGGGLGAVSWCEVSTCRVRSLALWRRLRLFSSFIQFICITIRSYRYRNSLCCACAGVLPAVHKLLHDACMRVHTDCRMVLKSQALTRCYDSLLRNRLLYLLLLLLKF